MDAKDLNSGGYLASKSSGPEQYKSSIASDKQVINRLFSFLQHFSESVLQ
jgi:hypothetical protein